MHGFRYLTSDTNLIADATLGATNVIASQAFAQVSRDADGGGLVELTGSYTGAADATFEIEKTSDTITGAPQLSAPVYAGIGNGVLSALTASSGIAAQEFTITCLDTGTTTRKAWAPFQSVNLRARTAGTAGNDLSLRISQAGLTATATDYSLTAEIQAGQTEYEGSQWDFGAVVLEPEGTIPDSAPRLRFGDSVEVYRHWKTYRAGKYRYHFSPEPPRNIAKGTRVYAITGGREVTIYDGATLTETCPDPVDTLYTLLTWIQSSSTLIEVDGVIANDRRPGGMACDDLTVQTASYVGGSVREGTRYAQSAAITVTAATDAPTESLQLLCIAAPIPGAEIWSVVGDVSGRLDDAVSGVAYADGDYAFTIPRQLQPGASPEGDRAAYLELLSRGADEVSPVLCVSNFLLGAEARQAEYTFTWAKRPAGDCNCTGASVRGFPINDFLGIDPPQSGGSMSAIPAAILSRVGTITDWKLTFIESNVAFATSSGSVRMQVSVAENADDGGTYWSYANGYSQAVSAWMKADTSDIRLCEQVAAMFEEALFDIYTQLNALPSGAGTEFDTQFAAFDTFMSPLETLVGSQDWENKIRSSYAEFLYTGAGTAKSTLAEQAGMAAAKALAESGTLTNDTFAALARARAAISKIYHSAGLRSPFEVATLTGNSVWSDHGGDAWFESSDGLLPVQPGYYYHSCRMQDDGSGNVVPTALKMFGIGVAIGCENGLKYGDKLIIKTGPYANARGTYAESDSITWEIIRADPVALGGGQTGDDTITFSVRGSAVGALTNYALDTTAPVAYSDGGLGFLITPGAIDFQVQDQWSFSAEGGTFRWRKNAGSWTTGVQIASTVTLSDGVSASFVPGQTPSWVTGDVYVLSALAVNGVAQIAAPDDGAFSWTGSTVIDITPTGAAACVMIASHTIPAGATITLSASDDNWATDAYSVALARQSGVICKLLDQSRTHAKWRLTINTAGSIGWLYLGPGAQLYVDDTRTCPGDWAMQITTATARRARGVAGDVTHRLVTYSSWMTALDSIEHAAINDDGRLGVISPAGFGAFCRIDPAELSTPDLLLYQYAEPAVTVTVPLQAA